MGYAGVKVPQQLQGAQRKVAEWESGVPGEMEIPQHEKVTLQEGYSIKKINVCVCSYWYIRLHDK